MTALPDVGSWLVVMESLAASKAAGATTSIARVVAHVRKGDRERGVLLRRFRLGGTFSRVQYVPFTLLGPLTDGDDGRLEAAQTAWRERKTWTAPYTMEGA